MGVFEQFDDYAMPEPNSGCHIWMACLNENGYGVVRVNGRSRLAHRISLMRVNGEYPAGNVLHHCDVPACVNPDHLYIGTQLDNVRDMDRRGRRKNAPRSGMDHHNAKLTPDQVAEARSFVGPARILASKFGVTPEQINNIRRGTQRRVS